MNQINKHVAQAVTKSLDQPVKAATVQLDQPVSDATRCLSLLVERKKTISQAPKSLENFPAPETGATWSSKYGSFISYVNIYIYILRVYIYIYMTHILHIICIYIFIRHEDISELNPFISHWSTGCSTDSIGSNAITYTYIMHVDQPFMQTTYIKIFDPFSLATKARPFLRGWHWAKSKRYSVTAECPKINIQSSSLWDDSSRMRLSIKQAF